MPIITITSDFGDKDYYQSVVKAKLRKLIKEVTFFDISHHISHFNTKHGALVFNAVFDDFEEESIHLLSFNTLAMNPDSNPKYVVVECDKKFIIAPNNGTLSLLNRTFSLIKGINKTPKSFPTLEIFVPIVQEIAKQHNLDNIGETLASLSKYSLTQVRNIDENTLKGDIVYIDSYGNLVTNIHKEDIDKNAKGRRFSIKAGRRVILNRVDVNYGFDSTRDGGNAVAIFNHLGVLEISNSYGNAKELFGLNFNSPILISFHNASLGV